MPKRERFSIIDVLILLATILVLTGHHRFLQEDFSWYIGCGRIIYSFHMGFFMAISGFLVKYTFSENRSWVSYVGKKAKKFIPAYFTVGLLAALISSKTIGAFAHNLLMLVVSPVLGPIQIIWYIYVLFMFYCLAPFIFRLSLKWRYLLLVLSFVPAAFFFSITPYFCLNHFFRQLPFFLLGTLIADNFKKVQAISDSKLLMAGFPFIAFVIGCIFYNDNPMPEREGLGKIITTFMALPLMYWIGKKLMRIGFVTKISTSFSPYVYSVYLWQMYFIEGLWMLWQRTNIQLNDGTAVIYLFCSVAFTILGIVLMMKSWRWLSVKIRKPE